MKTYLDCLPCLLRHALDSSRLVTAADELAARVMDRVLVELREMDPAAPPPAMGQRIHRIIREELGHPDPYRDQKERFTRWALQQLPSLEARVRGSTDPLLAAARIAIVGNLIDFGPVGEIQESALEQAVQDALDAPLFGDDDVFRREVATAGSILYLADNAGEIVFDRLLVEQLPAPEITVAVRGSPVLNDATLDDARAAGFSDRVRLIDNGSDAPATILDQCSDAFRQAFLEADVVIAKGQGNYESLSDARRPVFFLLKAKCHVVAEDLGCEVGALVLKRSR